MSGSSLKSGFTFIELAVVMGMMSILIGIATISLNSLQNRTNFASTINLMISDIKQQQVKAMVGDAERGISNAAYGIHFQNNPTQYVIFHGNSYSSADASNFPMKLDSNLTFSSISLPNNNSIIFDRVSGNMNGYSASTRTVTLKNISNNEQQTIQFNRYGVIVSVN
jgi:prepilin-type N-terminal cleavage/methylation domain-containing protein